MPWDSNGNFVRNYNWEQDAANGIDIEADRMQADAENFRTGIQDCLHRGGFNSPTANLPMATRAHTNVGNADGRRYYGVVGEIQDNVYNFASNVASSNGLTYDLTVDHAPSSPGGGFSVAFVPNMTNLGAVLIKINGGTSYPAIADGAALEADDLVIGRVYTAYFYANNFHIISGASGSGTPVQAAFSGSQVVWELPPSPQLIASSTVGSVVQWNLELMDTDDYWSPGAPEYFVAPTNGVYLVALNILMKPFAYGISTANNMMRDWLNKNSETKSVVAPGSGHFHAMNQSLGYGPPDGNITRNILSYCAAETWLETSQNLVNWDAQGGTQTTNFIIKAPTMDQGRYITASCRAFIALAVGHGVRAKILQESAFVDLLGNEFEGASQVAGPIEVVGESNWQKSSWFSIERVRDSIPTPLDDLPS